MDCKANKSRTIEQVSDLGREAHLLFEFDGTAFARVSSIKTAQAAGLLGHVKAEFDEARVAPANIAIEDFYTLCAQRDSAKLVDICMTACLKCETSAEVASRNIVAVVTNAGKFGLFLVKTTASKSISVDACHVLLP